LLRSKRWLSRRSPKGEGGREGGVIYLYILQSEDGAHFYVGMTHDLVARLKMHNAGKVTHTAKHGPWGVRTYVAFEDADRAALFERYLKTASGRAFATKRF
jgi:predicted GIY-YIG superfamily endonuclease